MVWFECLFLIILIIVLLTFFSMFSFYGVINNSFNFWFHLNGDVIAQWLRLYGCYSVILCICHQMNLHSIVLFIHFLMFKILFSVALSCKLSLHKSQNRHIFQNRQPVLFKILLPAIGNIYDLFVGFAWNNNCKVSVSQ